MRGIVAEQRFWNRVKFVACSELRAMGDCAMWQGYVDQNGYGQFWGTSPHRWAFERYIGPIPDGREIDHLCRNRSCANPLHLEAVFHRTNMERSAPKLRATCKAGHPFTPDNTNWFQGKHGPYRQCKACAKRRSAEFRTQTEVRQ